MSMILDTMDSRGDLGCRKRQHGDEALWGVRRMREGGSFSSDAD